MKKTIPLIAAMLFLLRPCAFAEQAGNSELEKTLDEIRQLHREATENYEEGNLDKAQALYKKAIQKLYSCDLNPNVMYNLRNDFEFLFEKLGKSERELENSTELLMQEAQPEKKIFYNHRP